MDDCTLFTSVDLWKDIKKLSKHIKPAFLECDVSPEEFEKLSISEKISSISILRQISNTINSVNQKKYLIIIETVNSRFYLKTGYYGR